MTRQVSSMLPAQSCTVKLTACIKLQQKIITSLRSQTLNLIYINFLFFSFIRLLFFFKLWVPCGIRSVQEYIILYDILSYLAKNIALFAA